MMALPHYHGLETVALRAADGARAVVALHGGHVMSWVPAGGEEMLYLSPRSAFAAGQAIRGGVPVIFPQFSNRGPLLRHGFARVLPWQLLRKEAGDDPACAVLRLADGNHTQAHWPHAFALELLVRIGPDSLTMALSCLNTGTNPFQFSCALHTYLRTADVEQVAVEGLSGCRYLDAVDGQVRSQASELLRVEGELDRVYQQLDGPLALHHGPHDSRCRLVISQSGFEDAVVWNPGAVRCGTLADMPADGWRHMVCVEAACVERPIVLEPGQRWTGAQTLRQDCGGGPDRS